MQYKKSITFEDFIKEYISKDMKQFYLKELGEKTNFFATEGYIDSAEDEVEFWRKIKSNSDYKYKIFDAL